MIYEAAKRISDTDINRKLLDIFLLEKRCMVEDKPRARILESLVQRGVFMVPFDSYIKQMHGTEIRKIMSEYYNEKGCIFTGKLVMPLVTLNDKFMDFLLHETDIEAKYIYPVRGVFSKARYMQTTGSAIIDAVNKKYIVVVEGVFDEISLNAIGVPTVSLSGPVLHNNIAMFLDVIPNKIIMSDEDRAGKSLFLQCREKFRGNIVSVSMPCKDIDEYLRVEDNVINLYEKIKYNEKNNWINNFIRL